MVEPPERSHQSHGTSCTSRTAALGADVHCVIWSRFCWLLAWQFMVSEPFPCEWYNPDPLEGEEM